MLTTASWRQGGVAAHSGCARGRRVHVLGDRRARGHVRDTREPGRRGRGRCPGTSARRDQPDGRGAGFHREPLPVHHPHAERRARRLLLCQSGAQQPRSGAVRPDCGGAVGAVLHADRSALGRGPSVRLLEERRRLRSQHRHQGR